MKLSLVVAQGVHSGKVIPIASSQFLVGRDPHCNLRPASPAVSKQHAGIFVRDGKIFLKDYGSTNGSFVNDEQVVDEREIKNDDKLKIGPLEFVLRVEQTAGKPLTRPPAAAPVARPLPEKAQATTVVVPPVSTSPPTMKVAPDTVNEDPDSMAAMLLMEDAGPGSSEITAEQGIPDGTTVMEIPAVPAEPGKPAGKLDKIKEDTKNNSDAAKDLLRKYMNRPRS
jgi:pSer/pThr/pTyr-binding forkhead associated (FHA) protein